MGSIGIELEQAVKVIENSTGSIRETEVITVLLAGGRILAGDITASFDQPPFPRSPLDGYAFAAEAVNGANRLAPVSLPVTAVVNAGDYLEREIAAGEAVRIMTGAAIPAGCNCVIRQEDVMTEEGRVLITRAPERFENYCFAGEDYKAGTKLLNDGDVLHFAELGMLASAGHDRVKVYCKPRIALFSTGDELAEPGTSLPPGKIYDSNLFMMYARLKELDIDVVCAEQLRDDPEGAAARLRELSTQADGIITTGGVSVGEKDIFHQILPLLGCERLFWRVQMKPGTPAMFSVLNRIPMLNLSGNPFAAATTFELLARPLLYRLAPNPELLPQQTAAVLENEFSKESKGRRFIRAAYDNGRVKIPALDRHASGILASMKGCNCLIDIPAKTGRLEAGDTVSVLLL